MGGAPVSVAFALACLAALLLPPLAYTAFGWSLAPREEEERGGSDAGHGGAEAAAAAFLEAGAVLPARFLVSPSSWYRFLTYVFLHRDAEHLFNNLATFLLTAPLLEARLGSGLFASVAAATTVATGVANALLFSHTGLIGASGLCMTVLLLSGAARARYLPAGTAAADAKGKVAAPPRPRMQLPLPFLMLACCFVGREALEATRELAALYPAAAALVSDPCAAVGVAAAAAVDVMPTTVRASPAWVAARDAAAAVPRWLAGEGSGGGEGRLSTCIGAAARWRQRYGAGSGVEGGDDDNAGSAARPPGGVSRFAHLFGCSVGVAWVLALARCRRPHPASVLRGGSEDDDDDDDDGATEGAGAVAATGVRAPDRGALRQRGGGGVTAATAAPLPPAPVGAWWDGGSVAFPSPST